jgi:ABC-type transport system involved in multi-copper enzyme maturation permease subunit
MNRIIKFELKKILRSKLTIGVLILSFLLIIYSFLPKMLKYTFYNGNGNQIEKHKGIILEKEVKNEIFSKLQTNEEIQLNIQKLSENYGAEKNKTGFQFGEALPKDIYYEFYKPREGYFHWIAENYASNPFDYWNPHDLAVKFNELNDFYIQRQKKVQNRLNTMKYSRVEKEYWDKKANATKGPYQYGYFRGWTYVDESLDIFMLVIVAIGIAISGVYSNEHETGADAVLLSSKYGKTKLVVGKIIASLIFSMCTVLLGILLCILPLLLFFGIKGWDLPIQVLGTDILYNWNLLKMIGIRIFMTILSALVVTTMALILSSIIKKTTPVVVIVMILYIGGLFVPSGKANKLYQMIVKLSPVFLNGRQYYGYVAYPAFGKVFTFYEMATFVYILLSLILLRLSGRIFKRHQVQ